MLACLFTMIACWMVIAAFPETPVGRAIRQALVERPAARLVRVTRGDAAVLILIMLTAAMVALVGEGDGVAMLALGAPDVAIWLTTFEVSAYVDILIGLGVVASSLRGGGMARYAGLFARRGRARANRRSARLRRNRSAKADNDDDRPMLAIAVAA